MQCNLTEYIFLLTFQILWLHPDTPMNKVISYILNPSCTNTQCPNKKTSKIHDEKTNFNNLNSVWKVEIRIRYIPKNLDELYKIDRQTCHFFFDQVKSGIMDIII